MGQSARSHPAGPASRMVSVWRADFANYCLQDKSRQIFGPSADGFVRPRQRLCACHVRFGYTWLVVLGRSLTRQTSRDNARFSGSEAPCRILSSPTGIGTIMDSAAEPFCRHWEKSRRKPSRERWNARFLRPIPPRSYKCVRSPNSVWMDRRHGNSSGRIIAVWSMITSPTGGKFRIIFECSLGWLWQNAGIIAFVERM